MSWLDLSACPRCGEATRLNAQTSGLEPARLWWCERCSGWWRQVNGRDATWVPRLWTEGASVKFAKGLGGD